ncbi:MAG: oxidation resistance protein 1 [Alyxoria varia]|nr:MAG: oxidation resistance protein 1 [Alyxoria varia]
MSSTKSTRSPSPPPPTQPSQPESNQTSHDRPQPHSTSSILSYPVKHVVSSAFRRISSDPRSFAGSRSRSPNGASSTTKPSYSNGNNPDENSGPSSTAPSSRPSSINLSSFISGLSAPKFARTPSSRTSAAFEQQQPPGLEQHNPAIYTPPQRSLSPFQPPPLTPLVLKGYNSSTPSSAQLLGRLLAEEIRLLVPPRLQLVSEWRLLFSLEQDGASLATLFKKCNEEREVGLSGARGGFVVVVRDSAGGTFGAYLTDPPHPSGGHYYGTGECFLWRSSILPSIPTLDSLPPPPSSDTTYAVRSTTIGPAKPNSLHAPPARAGQIHASPSLLDDDTPSGSAVPTLETPGGSNGARGGTLTPRSGTQTPERIRFKAFPYSGENDYMIFCEQGFLSVGGGDGHFGLWIDGSLESGVSQACPTFGNEPLSCEDEATGKFDVLGVEVWWVGGG